MRRLVLALALTAAVAAAPAAHAAPSDPYLPVMTGADGVRLVRSSPGDQWLLRFGKKADRLYRRQLGGRRVQVVCGDLTPQPEGGGLFSTSTFGTAFRSPRKRGVFATGDSSRGLDLCAVSTRRRDDETCLNAEAGARRWCLRVVVARTALGRTRIDEFGRHFDVTVVFAGALSFSENGPATIEELQGVLGSDIVALATRDAVPRRGTVGYWTDGEAILVAAVTRAGIRRFISLDGDVYSTNLSGAIGLGNEVGLFD